MTATATIRNEVVQRIVMAMALAGREAALQEPVATVEESSLAARVLAGFAQKADETSERAGRF